MKPASPGKTWCAKIAAALSLAILLPLTSGAQLTVSASQTAQLLAQRLAGSGITVSNPVLSCPSIANGIFSGVSNLGIDSGILLTSGRAATVGSSYGANGPASVNASANNNGAGDPQLAPLANSTTYNACGLEFDFIAKGDSVQFDYVFGSEEYNNSTCGPYNDAFAFFISGPGIPGQQNMALVPGTAIPVAVNSINSGVPGPQGNLVNCTSMGAGSPFTVYYVDNLGGTTVAYRGFTKVLKAVRNVQPCSTYHLKLTIADAGNALFDSGVFIRAGSLKTVTYTIKPDQIPGGAQPFLVKGCAPGALTVKRSEVKSTAQTIKFLVAGTAVNGVDYALIADSVVIPANDSDASFILQGVPTAPGGSKTVKLLLLSPYGCNGPEVIDSVTVTLFDGLQTDILTPDTVICQGQTVNIRVSGDPAFSYSWTPSAGLSNPTSMQPTAAPTNAVRYVLTTSSPNAGCPPKFDTLNILVDTPVTVEAGLPQQVCVGQTIQLTGSISPPYINASLAWSGPNGYTSVSLSPVIERADATHSGVYALTARHGTCPAVQDSVRIDVYAPPAAPLVPALTELCLNTVRQPLRATGSNLIWYDSQTGGPGTRNAIVPPSIEGRFVYYVSQSLFGCESSRARADVVVTRCCEDNLFIPTAITPNGDGQNDRFQVRAGPEDFVLQCNVYNRWGQLVFKGSGKDTWDGTIGGQPAESGTYFYSVLLDCHLGGILEKKGDLTVIR